MSLLTIAILAANAASAAILVWTGVHVLNAMSARTCHCMRLTYLLLAIGGVAVAGMVYVEPQRATWQQTLPVVGVAILLLADRRIRRRPADCEPAAKPEST